MKKLIVILFFPLLAIAGGSDNPDYKQGYEDGCQSGKADWLHPFKQDADKYIDNKYYKAGWDAGQQRCEAEYKALDEAMGPIRW